MRIMDCLSDKTLPNDDSDFSLPGRIEESDSAYFGEQHRATQSEVPADAREDSRTKGKALAISAIVFAAISAGFFSYYFLNQDDIDSQILYNAGFKTLEEKMAEHYGIGKFGSAHAHAAIAVYIDGNQLDFGMPQFQLQSRYIHFENENPYQIHKHATGVPLHMLFTSFGMEIKDDCINLRFLNDLPERYCANDGKSLTLMVNGKPHSSIVRYEINHNDRILISLGSIESVSEQQRLLESLEIHDVPKKNKNPAASDRDILV